MSKELLYEGIQDDAINHEVTKVILHGGIDRVIIESDIHSFYLDDEFFFNMIDHIVLNNKSYYERLLGVDE